MNYISKVKLVDGTSLEIKDAVAREKCKNVTYSELVLLRSNALLIPGQFYRITDYQCTTVLENTQSAGHVFDIIVRADSTNTLNENAYAALHSGDTYFANSKLEAWKLMYCIDNDTTRFAWADATNGKGVIYRMIDEWNNDLPYDFKNIQYVKNIGFTAYSRYGSAYTTTYERYGTNDKTVNDTLYYGFKRVSYVSGPGPMDEYVWTTTTALTTTMSLYKVNGSTVSAVSGTITVVDTSSFATYTFDQQGSEASISGSSKNVFNNSIASYVVSKKITINAIYFRTINSSNLVVYGNTFGNSNYNMTFGNNCNGNSFGNGCNNNSFGNDCYGNSFGNYCYNNSFGNSCQYNSFGNSCQYNSFGNYCANNSFGNYCYNNSFGNSCQYNSFGNDCNNNSFGDGCYKNSFGNNCNNNSFGNNCNGNSFGNDCKYIKFQKDYIYYCIIENGNQYINITSTQTTSPSNRLRNITIAQGVNNSTTVKTISHNTVNDTFKTTYQPTNSQIVNV